MGRAVARRLAAEGARLTIFDLNAEAAAETRYGGLDVMISIAGIIRPMHFLDVTEENWRSTLDVNGLGFFDFTPQPWAKPTTRAAR
jgi:meso-butanediol dehydrogenase/(S,S)-butanediol dehydrogenase/diacetyl reductase